MRARFAGFGKVLKIVTGFGVITLVVGDSVTAVGGGRRGGPRCSVAIQLIPGAAPGRSRLRRGVDFWFDSRYGEL
ncbi:uncharacterized protein LOC110513970 isoform X5 [Oncorhynchus mykiss]|uniref:uncharacterized protein LOC110513970 isoform X5 n=1 Tax=Oncorhynchus mykiss TaxID=8022 RepID=UPI0018776E22|nr:uncharacterized protein LOC110513970 isoform X5 [Oncorhynchus mykiss]